MARFPLTPEAGAAQAKLDADGLCYVEPIPFLAVLDELRTIEIGKDEVVMNFDNTGDRVDRIIHLNASSSRRTAGSAIRTPRPGIRTACRNSGPRASSNCGMRDQNGRANEHGSRDGG